MKNIFLTESIADVTTFLKAFYTHKHIVVVLLFSAISVFAKKKKFILHTVNPR